MRVNDPRNRLATLDASGKRRALLIGVWTANGVFLRLTATAVDALGRNYQLPVPENVKLRMSLNGGGLELQDEKKATPGANTATIEFERTPADDRKQAIVFHVK